MGQAHQIQLQPVCLECKAFSKHRIYLHFVNPFRVMMLPGCSSDSAACSMKTAVQLSGLLIAVVLVVAFAFATETMECAFQQERLGLPADSRATLIETVQV